MKIENKIYRIVFYKEFFFNIVFNFFIFSFEALILSFFWINFSTIKNRL